MPELGVIIRQQARRAGSAPSCAPELSSLWPNGYHESAWRVVEDDVRGVLGLSYYAGRVAPSSCTRPPGRGPAIVAKAGNRPGPSVKIDRRTGPAGPAYALINTGRAARRHQGAA
jgi:hypothetical protein